MPSQSERAFDVSPFARRTTTHPLARGNHDNLFSISVDSRFDTFAPLLWLPLVSRPVTELALLLFGTGESTMHRHIHDRRSHRFRQRPRVFPTPFMRRERQAAAGVRVVLWRMRGAVESLVCVSVATSFGYALGLELGAELILLELQPSLELLVAKSARLERWLLAHGWLAIEE